MEEKRVRVGVVGFGTVGSGVAKLILEDADAIASKMGVRLELACVVDVDTERPRPVQLPAGVLTNDLGRLVGDKSISVGVELVGGTGIAKEVQLKMLRAGKDVVTANKALLATHGPELYRVARERPVHRLRSQLCRRNPHHRGDPNGNGGQPDHRHVRDRQWDLQLHPLQHELEG